MEKESKFPPLPIPWAGMSQRFDRVKDPESSFLLVQGMCHHDGAGERIRGKEALLKFDTPVLQSMQIGAGGRVIIQTTDGLYVVTLEELLGLIQFIANESDRILMTDKEEYLVFG